MRKFEYDQACLLSVWGEWGEERFKEDIRIEIARVGKSGKFPMPFERRKILDSNSVSYLVSETKGRGNFFSQSFEVFL
tara:strand:- start:530 stop:763 length:234 start_codon:yes stop_codon:yes gene_type:complete